MAFLLLAKWMIRTPSIPRFFSSSTHPETPNFSIVDYLTTSFGFSPDRAARLSKRIAHLNSPEKPDAVHRFLDHYGFDDSQIRTIIARRPCILASSVEKSLNPNLLAFRDMGLSESTLTQLILSNPHALCSRSIAPRIKFWTQFFGGDQTALSRAFKNNRGLANNDIDRTISPNLSLLQNYGFSTEYIRKIVLQVSAFIVTRVSLVEDWILRAKELGFQPGTGMFLVALQAVGSVTREDLQRKRELLLSFGWSEDELFNAVQKAPTFLALGEKNLQAKMNFLMEEARLETSYIACHPDVLTYSLEKRLRPRLYILRLLESKGSSATRRGFYSVIKLTDNKFVETCILPFKEEISGLHEAFLDACAGETTRQFGKLK